MFLALAAALAAVFAAPTIAADPKEAAKNPAAFDPKGFQTDLFTGSASTSIPIAVEPGTGGCSRAWR